MFLITTIGLFISTSPALVMALGIDADDVPAACAAICEPLVQLSLVCDEDDDITGDAQEELLETDCICNNADIAVADVTADCAACVADNIVELDDIEDVQEIAIACGF